MANVTEAVSATAKAKEGHVPTSRSGRSVEGDDGGDGTGERCLAGLCETSAAVATAAAAGAGIATRARGCPSRRG